MWQGIGWCGLLLVWSALVWLAVLQQRGGQCGSEAWLAAAVSCWARAPCYYVILEVALSTQISLLLPLLSFFFIINMPITFTVVPPWCSGWHVKLRFPGLDFELKSG